MKFQGCFKKGSRMLEVILKGVSISFKEVSRVERSLKYVSGKAQGVFKGV